LKETRSIEDRKLLQEALLSYVEYLRGKLKRSEKKARTYLYALLVVIPLGIAQLFTTYTIRVASLYARYIALVVAVAAVSTLTTHKVHRDREH